MQKMFMRVEEVAEELDVSVPYAYKLIRQMNVELKKTCLLYTSGNEPKSGLARDLGDCLQSRNVPFGTSGDLQIMRSCGG